MRLPGKQDDAGMGNGGKAEQIGALRVPVQAGDVSLREGKA